VALDVDAAEAALARLGDAAAFGAPPDREPAAAEALSPAERAALGVVAVANAGMERALRVISVQRGFDPADFTLVSYGGAGGLHACELARGLGIRRVLVPRGASTLSAFGMLAADVVKDYVRTVMREAAAPSGTLRSVLDRLCRRAEAELAAEGVAPNLVSLHPMLDVRYVGQSYELSIPFEDRFTERFHAEHERAYGYSVREAPVEVVNVRLKAVGAVRRPELPRQATGDAEPSAARIGVRPLVAGSRRVDAPLFDGDRLEPGHVARGPAVVAYTDTTVFIPGGDALTVDDHFGLVIAIDA
jgi:N-methylhydantoinase A